MIKPAPHPPPSQRLRERGQPFFFLPMFGFADEQAIIKQENAV